MHRADRNFLGLGIVIAIFGMCLGIYMGITDNFLLAPVHAHVNLVGWVSLSLFGMAYRSGLARNDGWAMIHFWIAAAGAIVFPLGLYFAVTKDQSAVAIVGSLLTVASMLLFGVNFLRARAE